jgi:hypothetical protein
MCETSPSGRPPPPPPPTLSFCPRRSEDGWGWGLPMPGEENPMQWDGRWGGGRIASHRTAPVGCGSHVAFWTAGTDPRPRTCRRIRQSGVVATRRALSCVQRWPSGWCCCDPDHRMRTCARRGNSFCCRIRSVSRRDCDLVCLYIYILGLV